MRVKITDAERDFYTALGKKLQLLREREGLDLYQMAKKLGVRPAKVFRWETGENRISVFDLVQYRQAIDPDSLSSGITRLACRYS